MFKSRDSKKKFYIGLAACSALMLIGTAVAGIAAPLAVIKNNTNLAKNKSGTVVAPWSASSLNSTGNIGSISGSYAFNFSKSTKNNISVTQASYNGSKTKNAVLISAPQINKFLQVGSEQVFYQWYIEAVPSAQSSTVSYQGFTRLLGNANDGSNSQAIRLSWSTENNSQTTGNVLFNGATQSVEPTKQVVPASDFANPVSPITPINYSQITASSFYLTEAPSSAYYIFVVMYYPVAPNQNQVVSVSNISEITY